MKYSMLRFPGFKRKALTLSYDDGVVYDERLMEIMKENGLRGTFNLNSGLFSTDGKRRLTKEQAIKLFKDSGNEVAIHGAKHLSLPEFPAAVAVNDVINDRVALENMFGRVINGMAYAYGTYNDCVVDVLRSCGVEYARCVEETESFFIPVDWLRLKPTCHHGNKRLMELAKMFVEDSNPLYSRRSIPMLFYLWGHSYEFSDENNWHIIEEFAQYMGGREDVWYATNIDICRYVKAFDSLVFSADGGFIYNPSATDVYIYINNNNILVKSGETTWVNQ